MLKKRITAIIALALVSTVSPLVYQYLIEPRMEGANVDIEITGIRYDDDDSSDDETAFTVYFKLTNDAETDVVVSPLELDVYYRSKDTDRYSLVIERNPCPLNLFGNAI